MKNRNSCDLFHAVKDVDGRDTENRQERTSPSLHPFDRDHGTLFVDNSPHQAANQLVSFFCFFCLAICFVLVLFTLSSNPLKSPASRSDHACYSYSGLVLNKGGVLYVDEFQQKGPTIGLLNAAGFWLGGMSGIWCLEAIFLLFAFVYAYKMARLFVSPFVSTLTVCLFFLTSIRFNEGGNLTETYAYPLILFSLYYFIQYYRDNCTLSWWKVILVGASCGFVFTLRPNMICFWGIFCLCVLYNSIIQKKYRSLFTQISLFTLGAGFILLPQYLYLMMNGAWDNYIYFCFTYNTKYYCDVSMSKILLIMVHFLKTLPILPTFLFYIFILFVRGIPKNEKSMYGVMGLAFLFSLWGCSISGYPFRHYAEILLPFFLIPFAWTIHFCVSQSFKLRLGTMAPFQSNSCFYLCRDKDSDQIPVDNSNIETTNHASPAESVQNKTGSRKTLQSLCAVLLTICILLYSLGFLTVAIRQTKKRSMKPDVQKTVDWLRANTDDRDSIGCLGDELFQVFIHSNRVASCQFAGLPVLQNIPAEIRDLIVTPLVQNDFDLFLVNHIPKDIPDSDDYFFNQLFKPEVKNKLNKDYHPVFQAGTYEIYRKNK